MSPNPPRKCLFCGGGKITGEHIYSVWMHPELTASGPNVRVESNSKLVKHNGEVIALIEPTVRKNERSISRTMNVVCRDCNSGWMSEIETLVQPHLLPLIRGEAQTVAVDAQRTISEWVTIKMMAMDAGTDSPRFFTEQEARQFGEARKIPDSLKVWISPLAEGNWSQSWEQCNLSLNLTGMEQSGLPNVASTTFGVGRVLFFGLYSRVDGAEFRGDAIIYGGKLHRIWPPTGHDIPWNLSALISDADAEVLTRVVLHDVRKANASLDILHSRVRLRVIEPVEQASIIRGMHGGPLFVGNEFVDLLCGSCSTVLCDGVSLDTLRGRLYVEAELALACTECGSFNLVPVKGTKRRGRGGQAAH